GLIARLDRDMRYTFVYSVDLLQAGVDISDMLGKTIFDFLPPYTHATTRDKLTKLFELGTSIQFEDMLMDVNGHIAHYGSRAAPIFERGQVVAALIISQDITEQVEAQRAST